MKKKNNEKKKTKNNCYTVFIFLTDQYLEIRSNYFSIQKICLYHIYIYETSELRRKTQKLI